MNIRSILFYSMIIVIVILSIYIIWFTKTEGYKCINQPLIYGVQHLSSSNNGNITCTCYAIGNPRAIIVTSNNISYADNLIGNSNWIIPK